MFKLPGGTRLDDPFVSDTPYIARAINMRTRLGQPEGVGLHGPLYTAAGAQITLPGTARYRTVFTSPSVLTGQVLVASNASVQLLDFDPASTPVTGTRWRATDVTPAALSAFPDVLPDPSTARVEIPPVWWFSDQDDLIVGQRANITGEPCHVWDRLAASNFVPIANSPTGAVGGGILNRILVLLGCTSFTDPDPQRYMTIRWSDRFDFTMWTPSDINLSGELQLEGGSRIVGGGVTGFGVIAWTDKRMALLTETFDPDSVFQRRYIDGGRGMMANLAWTEVDGQVWWFDESRTLNVFDGGRPRQIQNPLKYGTVERINDRQMARAYLVPNSEYGEIILHYPSGTSEDPDRQLVYNYIHDTWDVWKFGRTGWCNRYGVIHNLAVGADNKMYQHDLDVSLGAPWVGDPVLYGPVPTTVPAAEVIGVDFIFDTNLITMDSPTTKGVRGTRVMIDHLPMVATGAVDTFEVTLTGYAEPTLTAASQSETQTYTAGGPPMDFRVAGKAVMLRVAGVGVKTVFHFGAIDIAFIEETSR